MKFLSGLVVFVAATTMFIAALPGSAQPPVKPPLKAGDISPDIAALVEFRTFIRLKNVSPEMMAFWIDPKNHEAPPELGFGNRSLGNLKLALPKGVKSIVPLRSQNLLMISGTQESLTGLRQIIEQLDQPLPNVGPRVELETLLVSIAPNSLNGIWSKLAAQSTAKKPAMGLVTGNELMDLNPLATRRDAQILVSSQQPISDGFPLKISFISKSPDGYVGPSFTTPKFPAESLSPMPMFSGHEGIEPMPGSEVPTPRKVPVELQQLQLEIVPTFNEDGSLTLAVESSGLPQGQIESIANFGFEKSLVFAFTPAINSRSNRSFLIMTPHHIGIPELK